MTPAELQTYLHDHIPLSKAMEVSVLSIADDAVVLGAPLGPNINHRETVFGGSASAVAILACWSLLHLRLTSAGLESRVVIQRNEMDYLAPISGTFTARSYFEPGVNWELFVKMLTRKGRARASIGAVLEFEGSAAGRLTGEFVALGAGR
jgi:thioesterase domain-containing protein